ncbi:MAG: FAD binding domain-containing protein [Actinomycetota bacterium]
MIPAAFDYRRASSVEEAVKLLGSDPEAKVIAGGHSLLPLMRLRLARPSLLVDIARIGGLSYVKKDGKEFAIGALTRHHDLANDPKLAADCPILAYTAGQIGDPAVRHVGTIGGSVAHADPASDLPTVLLALDATFVVRGPKKERRVAAADFFRGLFTADLAHDELLAEIRVPATGAQGWSYQKFRRRAQDWAVVGVAVLTGNGDGPAVALTNMADRPMRAAGVEAALAGGADAATASARAAEGTSPASDAFASAEYRSEVSSVIVRRALEEAAGRRR